MNKVFSLTRLTSEPIIETEEKMNKKAEEQKGFWITFTEKFSRFSLCIRAFSLLMKIGIYRTFRSIGRSQHTADTDLLAERFLISKIQIEAFPEVFKALENNKDIPNDHILKGVRPRRKDFRMLGGPSFTMLVTDGIINKAEVAEEIKNTIIFPPHCFLAKLLVDKMHFSIDTSANNALNTVQAENSSNGNIMEIHNQSL